MGSRSLKSGTCLLATLIRVKLATLQPSFYGCARCAPPSACLLPYRLLFVWVFDPWEGHWWLRPFPPDCCLLAFLPGAPLRAYFVDKTRDNLHIVLAMSPIGDAFRERLRQFPSLVNCCTIDWWVRGR